jgi:hypothetical protein
VITPREDIKRLKVLVQTHTRAVKRAQAELNRKLAEMRRGKDAILSMVYAFPLPSEPEARKKEWKRRYQFYWQVQNPDYMRRYHKQYRELGRDK